MTQQFIKTKPSDLLPLGQWVLCQCPARIDISGGWSDTPPLTYESGGAVFNAAITVNGMVSYRGLLSFETFKYIVITNLSITEAYRCAGKKNS